MAPVRAGDAPPAPSSDPGAPPTPRASSLGNALGWAAYLACSWTWCIGMFLPVLLVRDYGIWGFIVFAVPNVLGAAAMGWVLRSRRSADLIVSHHRWAVRRFSWVTIAFHLFFLGWIVTIIAPDYWNVVWRQSDMALFVGAIALGIALMVVLVALRRLAAAAWLVWAASIILGVLVLRAGAWDQLVASRQSSIFRSFRPEALMFLAPAVVFGFALCPYLDATFLLTRRSLDPRHSRFAFSFGFGALFAVMILLTLGYSAAMIPTTSVVPIGGLAPAMFAALLPHLILQSAFTIAVHLHAVPRSQARVPRAALIAGAIILGLGLIAAGTLASDHNYKNRLLGEVIYRLFMSFYGLVFPAYVWICMIPTRGAAGEVHRGLDGAEGRVKIIAWLASVAIAAPAYWMGFIERQTVWLAPGLLVVLGARLVVLLALRSRTVPALKSP
ncbi:MAG: hypothetical protein AB7G11_05995 [Phycisphaerales bacterium]